MSSRTESCKTQPRHAALFLTGMEFVYAVHSTYVMNDARGVTVGIVRTDSMQCAVHLRWHEVQAAVQVVNADSTRLCIGAAHAIQRLHLHLVQGMQNLLRLLA